MAGDRSLTPAAAIVLAWAGLALVNAGCIAARALPNAGLRVRALNHLFDAGQLLCLGLVCGLAVTLWLRLAPRRPWLAPLALSLVAGILALAILAPDLDNFALRLAGRERAGLVDIVLTVALAQAVPLAYLVGRRMARPRIRWIAAAVATIAAIVNTQILPVDYPGCMHSWPGPRPPSPPPRSRACSGAGGSRRRRGASPSASLRSSPSARS
ncbi:hypothetical protein [Nannocystis pusilla]|uniref:hypothetical protein n=1 Tax=Nannocystis pusilla TaxID=889268 RepID=UPI003B7FA895